jgi:hypothetical protein
MARITGTRIAQLTALGLLVGLTLPLASGLPLAPSSEAPKTLLLDLSDYEDQTVTYADVAHIPVPAAAVNIGPGSHLLMTMEGGTYGCTANFIWSGTNGKTYLGAAGHCFVPPGKTATHGPGADYNPSGTTVRVCVASCNFGGESGFIITGQLVTLGPVAYARQTEGGVDLGHDFGIVEIPTSQAARVRPSMPVWGGPTTTETLSLGEVACHYGNGVGVGEVFPTMARAGVGMFGGAGITFGINSAAAPGDSGSAVSVCAQDAGGLHGRGGVGILTHIGVGSGVVLGTTISQAKAMATQAGLTINVVTGA